VRVHVCWCVCERVYVCESVCVRVLVCVENNHKTAFDLLTSCV